MIERAGAAPGKEDAEQRGDAGQQQALGEELADQPESTGPYGHPDAELAPARGDPGSQQRSYVRA